MPRGKSMDRREICDLFQDSFLITGIGSPLRSDDQVGLLLCDELMNIGLNCLKCEYGLENCVDHVSEVKPKRLIVIDAAIFDNAEPGDIVIASEDNLQSEEIKPISTHNIPLRVIVDMLKNTGVIEELYIIGIYPQTLEIGLEITPPIQIALKTLVNDIKKCFETQLEKS